LESPAARRREGSALRGEGERRRPLCNPKELDAEKRIGHSMPWNERPVAAENPET